MDEDPKQALLNLSNKIIAESSEEDLRDPVYKRIYQFFRDFVEFVVSAKGTDTEGARLESELEWLSSDGDSALAFPPPVFESARSWIRQETPKYRQWVAEFMEQHRSYMLTGQGDKQHLIRQIVLLKKEGFLSEETATSLATCLDGADDSAQLSSYIEDVIGKKPWWKNLF